MTWEIGIDLCALPHGKQRASGNLPNSRGCSAQGSVATWTDGIGVGGRGSDREGQEGGEYMYTYS